LFKIWVQYNDQVAETNEDILALWQKYFQDLSNPDFKQDFDYEKYESVVILEGSLFPLVFLHFSTGYI
jgi:hypothetical protein